MAGERSSTIAGILTATPPPATLEWAVRSVEPGALLVSVEALRGGSSHANHALRVRDRGGATGDFVLRRWVRPDWQETDPASSPDQEAATLRLVHSGGVPAPELVACDASAVACYVPALLMTRMPGRQPRHPGDMESFVRQLAAALGTIHAVDPVAAGVTVPPYRRYFEAARPCSSASPARQSLWERAIELARGDPLVDRPSFIHRDYHHGNTLWIRGRLSAVVDWTTASTGSPLVDVAHTRANLAMAFGLATADAFLAAWLQVEPSCRWDPAWDLRVAVDFLPDLPQMALSIRRATRLEEFLTQAIATIGEWIDRTNDHRGRGSRRY